MKDAIANILPTASFGDKTKSLSIRNITYFDNQPWPYPSGLMMGFVADYAGGEIKLQDEE